MRRGGQRDGARRPAHKLMAESTLTLDIRRWARAGVSNSVELFSITWHGLGEPEPQMSILKIADTAKLMYQVKHHSSNEWQQRNQVVPLSRTACRYGGVRKWFKCPECNRRCELLYFRFGSFACRLCQKIAYSSQSCGLIDRLTNKLHKLEAPVHGGRPKGMHGTTVNRINERVRAVEVLGYRYFQSRLAALGCEDDIFDDLFDDILDDIT